MVYQQQSYRVRVFPKSTYKKQLTTYLLQQTIQTITQKISILLLIEAISNVNIIMIKYQIQLCIQLILTILYLYIIRNHSHIYFIVEFIHTYASEYSESQNQYYYFFFEQTTTQMKFLDQEKEKDKKHKNKNAKVKEPPVKKNQENIFYNIYYPSNKVQCDTCEKDISKSTKITVKEKDYCVTCFSNIKELPENYHVINKLNFSLYEENWSAEEELLLFQGLQRHGYGNWNQIAEHIGTDKTKQQVEKHYQDVYLSNETFIPINKQTLTRRDENTLKLITPKTIKNQVKRGRKPKEVQAIVPQLSNPIQRGTLSTSINTQNVITSGHAAEIVGYMPKRGDFQVQYDNDAQLLLAEMQFNDDDTQQQKTMKYKLLDIYNYKLTERIKRKEFVIQRKLLDLKYQTQLDKNRTKQEREIYNMMKVFARFNTPEDHEKLVEGLIKEKQIRQKIDELRHYKKMGLRTFAEVEKYLQEKKKKDELRMKKQKNSESNFLYQNKINSGNNSRRTRNTSTTYEANKPEKRNLALTYEETKMCEKLDLSIHQYIIIKQTLIRECIKEGFIKKDTLEDIFKLQKQKLSGVFDFLVSNNVIMSKQK